MLAKHATTCSHLWTKCPISLRYHESVRTTKPPKCNPSNQPKPKDPPNPSKTNQPINKKHKRKTQATRDQTRNLHKTAYFSTVKNKTNKENKQPTKHLQANNNAKSNNSKITQQVRTNESLIPPYSFFVQELSTFCYHSFTEPPPKKKNKKTKRSLSKAITLKKTPLKTTRKSIASPSSPRTLGLIPVRAAGRIQIGQGNFSRCQTLVVHGPHRTCWIVVYGRAEKADQWHFFFKKSRLQA